MSTTRTVTDGNSLWTAVKASAGGDTILLAAGSYGQVTLNSLNVPSPGVTIKPVDGAKVVFNNIEHSGSSGLHYTGAIEVWTQDNTLHNANYGIFMSQCYDISVGPGVKVHGSVKANPGPAGGVGIFVRDCGPGIVIFGVELFDLGLGCGLMDVDSPVFQFNTVHDMETDGVDASGCYGKGLIDSNRFRDFYPAPLSHPDAIQCWGTTAHPAGDGMTITNNDIRRGHGGPMPMQGIFIEHQTNLTIRGNGMVGTLFNGISICSTHGALVEDNFVQGTAEQGTRIITRGGALADVGTDNVVVRNNIAPTIVLLVQATDRPVTNYSATANDTSVRVLPAPVAGGEPDYTDLDAWWSKRGGVPALSVPTPPVVVPTPVPVPVPTPATDPTLALQAQIAALTTQNAGLTSQLATATAGLKTASQQVTTLTDQMAQATASDLAHTNQLQADEALLAAIRTSLRSALGL